MYEAHPAFTPPPDDAILWRYMDFPKFVSFLESSSLFFARADQLGDPFEGSYSQVNFNTLTERYPAEVAEGLRKAMPGLARLRTNHFVNCWHWKVAFHFGACPGEHGAPRRVEFDTNMRIVLK